MIQHSIVRLQIEFKNKILSTLLGLRAFPFLETTNPALENNLSEGVDVAGILSHDLASLASRGKRCSLTFHHSSGLVSLGEGFSVMYWRTSCFAISSFDSSTQSSPNKISKALF